jgi:hypothetical protein
MEYRIKQDGMTVAGATSEVLIWQYAAIYRQDGPLTIQAKENGKRWKVIARVSQAGDA